jgi:GNAT superfamily N-acetyltransferase
VNGLRHHKGASLRVVDPTGLPEDMRSAIRELVAVSSHERGKGYARALMYQVTAEADLAGLVLMLKVEPFADGMTAEQLEKFYGSFGFLRIQDEPVLMAREPETPRVAYG